MFFPLYYDDTLFITRKYIPDVKDKHDILLSTPHTGLRNLVRLTMITLNKLRRTTAMSKLPT